MKNLLLMFLALSSVSATTAAQSVDMCKQIATSINHPAQYVTEKIQKKNYWHCVALPHCCTPGWVTDPACYVLKRKKIKDAWTEVRNTVACNPMSIEQGVKEFFGTIGQPAYHLTGGFYSAYRAYIDAAIATAQPLPKNVRDKLVELRYQHKYPARFNHRDVRNARWIRSDSPQGLVLFPATYGNGQADAITHDKLIVWKPDYFRRSYCDQFALWAHELVHVAQMREKGHAAFLRDYIQQAENREYRRITYEAEAYRTGEEFRRGCLRDENT